MTSMTPVPDAPDARNAEYTTPVPGLRIPVADQTAVGGDIANLSLLASAASSESNIFDRDRPTRESASSVSAFPNVPQILHNGSIASADVNVAPQLPALNIWNPL